MRTNALPQREVDHLRGALALRRGDTALYDHIASMHGLEGERDCMLSNVFENRAFDLKGASDGRGRRLLDGASRWQIADLAGRRMLDRYAHYAWTHTMWGVTQPVFPAARSCAAEPSVEDILHDAALVRATGRMEIADHARACVERGRARALARPPLERYR